MPPGPGLRARTRDRAPPANRTSTRSLHPAVAAPGSLFGVVPRLARGIDEEPEELAVGLQQHARVVVLQARFQRLHRAVEREEIRVAAERLGEDAVALGVALAADLLALGGGLGDQHGDVAVGPRLDLLGALLPLGAEFGCLPLAFGLHPAVHGLAVLLRQVGTADAPL